MDINLQNNFFIAPAFIEVRAGDYSQNRDGRDNRPHAEGGHETLIRLCGEYRKAANTIRLEKKKRKRAIGLP